jgi:hypothetical protein
MAVAQHVMVVVANVIAVAQRVMAVAQRVRAVPQHAMAIALCVAVAWRAVAITQCDILTRPPTIFCCLRSTPSRRLLKCRYLHDIELV